MSRTHRWYQHRERITLEVPTGGETHHMTWTDGRLRLHEHDLAAEAVLLALGGEACPCLVVRDAFRCQIEAPTPLPRPLRGPMRVQPNQPVFQRGGLIQRAAIRSSARVLWVFLADGLRIRSRHPCDQATR